MILNLFQHTAARRRLDYCANNPKTEMVFQHTAARRRLQYVAARAANQVVSTHSRPKAAVPSCKTTPASFQFQHTAARRRLQIRQAAEIPPDVSTHSRPKAAVFNGEYSPNQARVSTHSRPKAADTSSMRRELLKGFNTQPPEGGCAPFISIKYSSTFQHTAARRRLYNKNKRGIPLTSFNTQPPEGGWGLLLRLLPTM